EQPDPAPPEALAARHNELRQVAARYDRGGDDHGFHEQQARAAPAGVHLRRPQRGGEGVDEQRDDGQRVHNASSRAAWNILSPAATRGQAMRRARWEMALRSTLSWAAANAGGPSRSSVTAKRAARAVRQRRLNSGMALRSSRCRRARRGGGRAREATASAMTAINVVDILCHTNQL